MNEAKVVKRREITQAELKENLHYNPETGVFTRKIANARRVKVGDVAGCSRYDGYVTICINSKPYFAHRLAWLYMTGADPREVIDHINGNPADNRFCNLREANNQQNIHNQTKPPKNNTTGYLGVSFSKRDSKYIAHIKINGKAKHIGCYFTPELAYQAYLEAKRKHHEFCTI